ncbi:LOW QUALITY PROTEIN: NFATC2-interacting protein-like [Amphiura filiformis]|uniref:LOW QUALITY PROTEIN: NFATC2-interacting protein-like n=1 Tax=Amphiura filiformis TaxID=82378 RepID=UPI003B20D7BC
MAEISPTTEEKVAEVPSSSASSDEDDNPRPRKKAATKRRTYKPVSTDIPSCGIYSTLSTDSGLEQLKFTNLPAGFSLEDEDDEEDDIDVVSQKRRKPSKRHKDQSNNNSDLIFLGDSTPKRLNTSIEIRSPSPPPHPYRQEVWDEDRIHQRKHPKYSEILSAVLRYKITSLPSLNDSVSTPGGSSKVIDLDSPSSVSPRKRRKEMTVKIRTRGGMQKFIMQMNEMFTSVMETLAKMEGVDKSWIKLVKADDDISEYDTPSALKLRVSDILECVIVDPTSVPADSVENESLNITPSLDDCVEIKIQGQDRTSKMKYTLQKDRPMREIMAKYSQSSGVALDKLKFLFDGDVIDPSQTPEDLDMDEENAVDVIISG